jgi:hypothetical protein
VGVREISAEEIGRWIRLGYCSEHPTESLSDKPGRPENVVEFHPAIFFAFFFIDSVVLKKVGGNT